MQRPQVKKFGVLGIAVIAIMLVNVLIASANSVNATLSVDPNGHVNRIGQATVGGMASCDIPGSNLQVRTASIADWSREGYKDFLI